MVKTLFVNVNLGHFSLENANVVVSKECVWNKMLCIFCLFLEDSAALIFDRLTDALTAGS